MKKEFATASAKFVYSKNELGYQEVLDNFPDASEITIITYNISETFDAWKSLVTKEDTNGLVFISPKPKEDKEKEIKASISKISSNDTEALPFNTVLEIGICKLHINETTPFYFIEQIIKVVKEANV